MMHQPVEIAVDNLVAVAVAVAVKAKRITKKSRALELHASLGGALAPRSMAVAALMLELGCSKAMAATYVQNIRSGKWTTDAIAEAVAG